MPITRALIAGGLLLLTACAPQAQLVKMQNEVSEVRGEVKNLRTNVPDLSGVEKRLDRLEQDQKGTGDLQARIADHGARFDQFTTDLQLLQGRLEENNYRIKELAQKLDDASFRLAELGSRVEQMERQLKSLPADTSGSAAPAPAAPQSLTPGQAYQQAKTDYDKGNYDLAIAGFENYLVQFPDASQGDSARYWIGECWYSKKEYKKAIEEFQKLLKDHPKSEKAPGARLKIGYSYLNEKNHAKAKEHLNRVIKDYPGSREADLAREKLKKEKAEK